MNIEKSCTTAIPCFDIQGIINDIISMNATIEQHWFSSFGWAPTESAVLMSRSRLDRNISLSKTLKIWFQESPEDEVEARLILAWTNLGALVEGTLKLFLSVYLVDYRKEAQAPKDKKGKIIAPDTLDLEKMRVFMDKIELWTPTWSQYVLMIQQNRNAIHAYKERTVGTLDAFTNALTVYKSFIQEFNFDRLPPPKESF